MNERTTDRLERMARAALWVALGATLMVAVFVVSFFLAMRVEMRSTEVGVPDLAGLTLDEARARVHTLDLVLEVVDQRNDPGVASGRVLEQMPPSGASVRRGRKLKLILSLGGKVLQVPDLTGNAARTAVIEIVQQGFAPGDEARVPSYEVEAGRILAQVPAPGTSVVPQSRLHRLVSDGPPPSVFVMPDLTGRSRQDAERRIALYGFRQGAVRQVPAGGRPPGTVVAQLPESGYPVRVTDIVELAVAD